MEVSIFKSLWFQNLAVPIIFLVIGILANRLGRKDGDGTPLLNLWAAGTTILLMSLVATISDLGRANVTDVTNLTWIVVFLVMLFISIDFDRYGSWERDDEGLPTDCKHLVRGIIAPNIISLSLFIGYRFLA